MSKWEAVIFDLDDTLYPEREYVLSGFKVVAEVIGSTLSLDKEESCLEMQHLFDSGIRGDIFNRWLKIHNLETKESVSACIATYRDHIPRISPFPEVHHLLKDLKSKFKTGLVSDGYLEVQRKKMSALNLNQYFDAIVFSDEYGRESWKPSVKPFETVLQKLNCTPERSIYVADNVLKDFYAPRLLRMTSVCIKRSDAEYSKAKAPTEKHKADVTINSLKELFSAIDKLARKCPI